LVAITDRDANTVTVLSFDSFGNNAWRHVIPGNNRQVQHASPITISNYGAINFKITSSPGDQQVINMTSTLIRIGQLQITSVEPTRLFSDEKASH
jgi:hypothetical protein